MVTTAELADAQGGMRTLVDKDLEEFFASLDLSKPEFARDAMLEQVPVIIGSYSAMSAAVAADYYDELRYDAGIRDAYRAFLAASPYLSAIVPSVRRVAGALWTDDPTQALVGTQSFATKYALAAGRETVRANVAEDEDAYGYRRVARGKTCKFCLALVARGAVYRKSTAFFAAHGHCDCAAVPNFDPDAPEVEAFAYTRSVRTTNMSPAALERHRRETRLWIASLD